MLCKLVIPIGTFPYALRAFTIPWSLDQDMYVCLLTIIDTMSVRVSGSTLNSETSESDSEVSIDVDHGSPWLDKSVSATEEIPAREREERVRGEDGGVYAECMDSEERERGVGDGVNDTMMSLYYSETL